MHICSSGSLHWTFSGRMPIWACVSLINQKSSAIAHFNLNKYSGWKSLHKWHIFIASLFLRFLEFNALKYNFKPVIVWTLLKSIKWFTLTVLNLWFTGESSNNYFEGESISAAVLKLQSSSQRYSRSSFLSLFQTWHTFTVVADGWYQIWVNVFECINAWRAIL